MPGECPGPLILVVEGLTSTVPHPPFGVGVVGESVWGCSRKCGNTSPAMCGVRSVGTLLGPEGTTSPCRCGALGIVVVRGSCSLGGGLVAVGWLAGVGGGVRVVVENCTVDASIFVLCCILLNSSYDMPYASCRRCAVWFLVMLAGVLVKLSRAHGGCLGIRSR